MNRIKNIISKIKINKIKNNKKLIIKMKANINKIVISKMFLIFQIRSINNQIYLIFNRKQNLIHKIKIYLCH